MTSDNNKSGDSSRHSPHGESVLEKDLLQHLEE